MLGPAGSSLSSLELSCKQDCGYIFSAPAAWILKIPGGRVLITFWEVDFAVTLGFLNLNLRSTLHEMLAFCVSAASHSADEFLRAHLHTCSLFLRMYVGLPAYT